MKSSEAKLEANAKRRKSDGLKRSLEFPEVVSAKKEKKGKYDKKKYEDRKRQNQLDQQEASNLAYRQDMERISAESTLPM